MRSSDSKLLIIIFVLSLLFIFNTETILAEYSSLIELGNITALEEVNRNFFLKFSSDDFQSIDIWLSGNFYDKSSKQVLSTKRLIVKQPDTDIMLSTNLISLDQESFILSREEILINLQLKILPFDSPGRYSTDLFIKINGDKEEIIIKRIEFTIDGWTKIRYSRDQNLLINKTEFNTKNITSGITPYLEVASNTEWELYGRLNESQERLEIVLEEQKRFRSHVFNGAALDKKAVLLARGERTVSGRDYWLSIPFKLSFKDFTRLPAGRMEFPVVFFLREVD